MNINNIWAILILVFEKKAFLSPPVSYLKKLRFFLSANPSDYYFLKVKKIKVILSKMRALRQKKNLRRGVKRQRPRPPRPVSGDY